MSNEDQTNDVDNVLELLAKPLSKYVLSVLAGVDPGRYKGSLEDVGENPNDS
ncbi:MAG: hypothetical protein P1Q69_03435 [Candidatus Thorarchaeota archaeon]|nr:hypothetical protein [Candidatus Thorarchaeota archaeon]